MRTTTATALETHRRCREERSACRWGPSSSPIASASTSRCTSPKILSEVLGQRTRRELLREKVAQRRARSENGSRLLFLRCARQASQRAQSRPAPTRTSSIGCLLPLLNEAVACLRRGRRRGRRSARRRRRVRDRVRAVHGRAHPTTRASVAIAEIVDKLQPLAETLWDALHTSPWLASALRDAA